MCFNIQKYFSSALTFNRQKNNSQFDHNSHHYRWKGYRCTLQTSWWFVSYCLLTILITINNDDQFQSSDCPVERLPILPIHTGLFPQLPSARVRNMDHIDLSAKYCQFIHWTIKLLLVLKAVDEGAMVRYGCNGTREVRFSLSLSLPFSLGLLCHFHSVSVITNTGVYSRCGCYTLTYQNW